VVAHLHINRFKASCVSRDLYEYEMSFNINTILVI
jgi:hypothetical protein